MPKPSENRTNTLMSDYYILGIMEDEVAALEDWLGQTFDT
jgi:hypothetical protein